MDGDLFSFGEEEEKALKAQEKEDKRILEEKGFSLSDGDELWMKIYGKNKTVFRFFGKQFFSFSRNHFRK